VPSVSESVSVSGGAPASRAAAGTAPNFSPMPPGEQVDQRVVELLVAAAERQDRGKGGGRKEKSAKLQQLVEACAAGQRVKAARRQV